MCHYLNLRVIPSLTFLSLFLFQCRSTWWTLSSFPQSDLAKIQRLMWNVSSDLVMSLVYDIPINRRGPLGQYAEVVWPPEEIQTTTESYKMYFLCQIRKIIWVHSHPKRNGSWSRQGECHSRHVIFENWERGCGFLRILNYIVILISHLTTIWEPIFKILRKDQAIEWNENCQNTFDRIK